MVPQDVVVALKVENIISGWIPSRKLVVPKRDNIHKETMSDKIKRMLKNEIQPM